MVQRLLAVALCALMPLMARNKELSITERAGSIPRGSLVEVKLSRKEKPNKVVGRIQEADTEGIRVLVPKEDTVATISVPIAEVKALKILANADEDLMEKNTRSVFTAVRDGFVTAGNYLMLGLLWLGSDGG